MNANETTPAMPDVDALAGRRIVVVGTGAPGTAFLPSWLGWMMQAVPSAQVRVVLTRSAQSFVGTTALRTFSGSVPLTDAWDADGAPLHVELAQWAEGWLVHPATMSFIARLSAGLCDSPTMLAIQGSLAPVVVAASAPPGFVSTPVWRRYRDQLSERPNVHLLDPLEGISAFDPTLTGSPPVLFPAAAGVLAAALEREGAEAS